MSANRNPATQRKRTGRSRPAKATQAGTEPTKTPAQDAGQRRPRKGSAMAAAMAALDGKPEPMTAKEIYAEIRERKLAPDLKGKTPDQTIAAQLAVNAKQGRYVERATPGKFRLKRNVGNHGSPPR